MVAEKVHPVLLTAAQGGGALVTAGEGGQYRHLQTQCRADERFPQRLIPSIIGGRGRGWFTAVPITKLFARGLFLLKKKTACAHPLRTRETSQWELLLGVYTVRFLWGGGLPGKVDACGARRVSQTKF